MKPLTEDMLRAGQEALFEDCPEYTIEEREELAREVYLAMLSAAPAAPPDERSGLSWGGFNISGDAQSVREVRRLVDFHAARRVEAP